MDASKAANLPQPEERSGQVAFGNLLSETADFASGPSNCGRGGSRVGRVAGHFQNCCGSLELFMQSRILLKRTLVLLSLVRRPGMNWLENSGFDVDIPKKTGRRQVVVSA
jgi:hypothetical protein